MVAPPFPERPHVTSRESRVVRKFILLLKHIYLMDPTWVETRFSQDSYKQMYFLYLLAEGHIRPLNVPEANARLVAQTLNENDDFLPKLETHFVVTKDPKDKVSYLSSSCAASRSA